MTGMTRREFLQKSAISAAMLSFGVLTARAKEQDRVKIGIIGTGAQGQNLLRQLVSLPNAEVVAASDIYLPSRIKAQEITAGKAQLYSDHRAMLDRQDIEAIVIATPLYLHAPMTIDALKAGKHVFCEKAVAYSIEQAKQMAYTARETGKILQIGHQRHYSPIYRHARQLVREDVIGRVTHIRALWHRNGSWRRPVPDEKFERLINWRLYNEYSHGLMTELGSHQLDVVNWFLGTLPIAVTGFGGIDYWKDGREVFDNVHVIFEYPDGVKVHYSSITTNAYDGYGEWFFGDKGTLVLTDENKGVLFREPQAEKLDWQDEAKTEKIGGREAVVLDGAATKKRGPDTGEQLQYGGNRNAYYLELDQFCQCVRTGEKPRCTVETALPALSTVLLANEAMIRKTRLEYTKEMFVV
jgi:predicted dehydrogenase